MGDWIAEALRDSQADKERFHRTALMHLQQQYLTVQAKLDRAYDDRITGRITEELWQRKSGEREAALALLAHGTETENWLALRDAFRKWLVSAA